MKRIFAVDDSASIRLYLDKILGGMGYSVALAEDGVDALEKIRNNDDPIDVFLIDIVMKNMNGISLINHIREMDSFAQTPVIVLTNLNDLSMVEKAKEAGANCWISKPFDAHQIADVIENLTR